MNQLEKQYHKLKGIGEALSAVNTQALKQLTEFVKAYGNLCLNTDGVPHTVTDFDDEEHPTKQIGLVFWNPIGKLMVRTVSGETLSHFSFDDISYLIEDLSEDCLEYAESEKNYAMVNVPGRNGYSFMVKREYELSENRVIELCQKLSLFQDEQDAEYAEVVSDVTEDDIRHFKSFIYDIDEHIS